MTFEKEVRPSSVPQRNKHSFTDGVVKLISGQAVITILAIGSSVVMARALGTEGRGYFSLALLLPSMLVIFTDFGIGASGTRFAAMGRWPVREILSSHALAGTVRVIVTGIVGLALIAFAGDKLFPGVPAGFLVLGLLQLVPSIVAGFVLPILMGMGLVATYSRLLVLSSALAFGMLGAGWAIAGLSVRSALLLQLAAGFVTAIVIWRTTSRAVGGPGRPNVRYLAEACRFGTGVYASSIALFANSRLILLLINGYAGAAAVGLYTIAQTATERVYLLADSMGTILMPRVAEDPERNSARLTPIVFRIALAVATGVSIGLALMADWFVRILFTDAFVDAVPAVRLLLVSVVLSSGWRVLFQDLNGRGHSAQTAIVSGVAAVLGLGLAIVLLPRIGIEGAAWSAIVSAAVSLLAGVWLFGRSGDASTGALSLFVLSAKEREFVARLLRGGVYAIRLGPSFAWVLMRAYMLDGAALYLVSIIAPFRRRLTEVANWLSVPAQLYRARKLQLNIAERPLAGPALQLDELDFDPDSIDAIRSVAREGDEVILGEFDHYGRLVPAFGPINGMSCISEEQADPRRRAHVSLVLTPRGVGVRKRFFGAQSKRRFLRELRALEVLRETAARVPEIIRIDVNALTLVTTFIGVDLEQVLTTRGARLTGAEVRERLGAEPTDIDIHREYLNEGAKFIAELPRSLVESIHQQMRICHQHGIRLYDIKYGNVAIHYKTGLAYLIDFDAAALSRKPRSRAFLVECDRDTEKFNTAFGTSCLTHDRIRSMLRKSAFPAADKLYASTYIGHGLRIGPLWDRTTGFGRWHFILKRKFRFPKGARILSLGANNASIEIQLLRDGAEKVIAFERDEDFAAQGHFLVAACEWADNRKYELEYVLADMQEAAQIQEKFDCVLALCSLYYLPEEDMRKVANAVAKLSPRFLLQCNVRQDIGREESDQYRRASVEFAAELLRDAGFSSIFVTAPRGYSRPLVEGSNN